jgi:hypothetical protein
MIFFRLLYWYGSHIQGLICKLLSYFFLKKGLYIVPVTNGNSSVTRVALWDDDDAVDVYQIRCFETFNLLERPFT